MENDAIVLAPEDDVATALASLRAGTELILTIGVSTVHIVLRADIPAGHKFALRSVASGVRVRKYGEMIGRLLFSVQPGEHIHTHNLVSCAGPSASRAKNVKPTEATGLRVIPDMRSAVGESPVWDEAAGSLYWVNIRDGSAVFRFTPSRRSLESWPISEEIGSVALANDGRLLAALRSGFSWFDPATGILEPIANPEPEQPENRLNDGKCDSRGRFWAGSMRQDARTADGTLYVLTADRNWRRTIDDLVTPNGISWSLDERTVYLADTPRGLIHAFDFDASAGSLANGRVFADTGALPGGPDGATVDAEDHLWSAQFDGGCLIRYAPNGDIERVVELPVSRPTSCTFGGEDYGTLFVTTAYRGLSAEQLGQEHLAGQVLMLDVGVAGKPPYRFG